MYDEYDVYIEQSGFSLDLEIETGAQGPAGPAGTPGAGFTTIASGTILGNGSGSPSLPIALEAAAARSVMNAASLAGNNFTGKQTFSGTDHVGLCLHSLTSAQYNALTPANGDIFRDSTTDRIDARLARGTVELLDTAGNQNVVGGMTIGGILSSSNTTAATLTTNGSVRLAGGLSIASGGAAIAGTVMISGFLDPTAVRSGFYLASSSGQFMVGNGTTNRLGLYETSSGSGTFEINNGTLGTLRDLSLRNITASGTVQFGSTVYRTDGATGLGTSTLANLWLALNGTQIFGSGNVNELTVRQSTALGFSNSAANVVSGNSVTISRASDGVLQIGTTGPNASGSVNFTNATASGTITGGLASTPVTFAVLNATTATATLGLRRITDRSSRLAYPDGTNWRFVSDDAIIS